MIALLHPVLPRLLAALSRRAVTAAPSVSRKAAPVWTLQPGQARTVVLSRGQALQVLAGRVWLTRPGDPRDHVLVTGQQHVAGARTAYVLEGLDARPVRFCIGRAE